LGARGVYEWEVNRKLAGRWGQCVAISLRPTASYIFRFIFLELTFIVLARPLEPPPSDAKLTNEDIKVLPTIGNIRCSSDCRTRISRSAFCMASRVAMNAVKLFTTKAGWKRRSLVGELVVA
jgi:hypothetical protein